MLNRFVFPVFVFSLILMGMVFSCKKQDTRPPVIYHPNIHNADHFTDGDTLLIKVTLTDNTALSSYNFSIIPDSNDHLKYAGQYLIHPFEYAKNFTIEGNTIMREDTIFIDTGIAAGGYKLILSSNDKSGLSQEDSIALTFSNHKDIELPAFNHTELTDSAHIISVFYFSDTLTDNLKLNSLHFDLIPEDKNLKTWSWTFLLNGNKSEGPWALVAPPDAGSYTLKIYVRDWVNNKRSLSRPIIID